MFVGSMLIEIDKEVAVRIAAVDSYYWISVFGWKTCKVMLHQFGIVDLVAVALALIGEIVVKGVLPLFFVGEQGLYPSDNYSFLDVLLHYTYKYQKFIIIINSFIINSFLKTNPSSFGRPAVLLLLASFYKMSLPSSLLVFRCPSPFKESLMVFSTFSLGRLFLCYVLQ